MNTLAKIGSRVGWTLVGLTAVFGVLVVSLMGLSKAGVLSTFYITSGSMAPVIEVGDLVVSRPTPAAEVEVGDVITVEDDNSTGYITHRVAEVRPGGTADERTFVLKGDANDDTDADTYTQAEVFVEQLVVPHGAEMIQFVSTPPTSYYLLLILGALMTITFLKQPARTDDADEPDADDAPADAEHAHGASLPADRTTYAPSLPVALPDAEWAQPADDMPPAGPWTPVRGSLEPAMATPEPGVPPAAAGPHGRHRA